MTEKFSEEDSESDDGVPLNRVLLQRNVKRKGMINLKGKRKLYRPDSCGLGDCTYRSRVELEIVIF